MLLWLSYGNCEGKMKLSIISVLFTLLLLKGVEDVGCQNDQVPPGTIIVQPQSVLAPLNTNTTFSCVAANAMIRWHVYHKDTLLRSSDEFDRDTLHSLGIFVVENGLIVSATEDNNGTSVSCAGLVRPPLTASETAFLTVYSLPAPPANLYSSPVAPLKLNLTWDAPWTPSIPEAEIQVNYTVRIENLNSSQNSIIEELQETHYVFSGRDTPVCTTYRFGVSARNNAGMSNESEMIISSLPRVPNITHSMQSLRHSVMFNNWNVLVNIMFEHTEFCEYYPVQYYSVRLNNSETREVIWAGPYFPSGDGDMEIHLDSSDGVQENVRYLSTIVATNEVGNGTLEESGFYTTDVQRAEISLGNRTANVTCIFGRGTEALGCHVELRPVYSRGNPLSVTVSRANGSYEAMEMISIPLPAACYDVLVRDWEADGTRGELDVPVDISSSEEGSGGLCLEPTGSSGINTEATSPLPTSGQDPTTISLSRIIVGGVSGAVVVLIVVVVVVIVTVLWYYKRIRKVTISDPAYEVPQLQGITTSRHIQTTTLSTLGTTEEASAVAANPDNGPNNPVLPSDSHDCELFSMKTNAAYATSSHRL